MATCSVVEFSSVLQESAVASCRRYSFILKMEAESLSETFGTICQTTRRLISEGGSHHIRY
jgi:hypothetical protein